MKLTLKGTKLVGGGIGNPSGDAILTASLECPFSAALAKRIGCPELYNWEGEKGTLRAFTYHGIGLEIPEGRIAFKVGNGDKARDFAARIKIQEITQKEGEATLRVKAMFSAQNKTEVFDLLFGGSRSEEAGFDSVVIEGAQQELKFEAEAEEGEGAEE